MLNLNGIEANPILHVGRLESIPLAKAVLCCNCEMITPAKNGHCPVCESTPLLNLANMLDRKADVLDAHEKDLFERREGVTK